MGKITYFSLIFHKSRIEKLATITFLSRCSYSPLTYLFMLPYSNVVPAPESHRSVASLLSSQSRIPFSGRYALVKLHGFTPPIFILSIRDKTKCTVRCQTTQAEFLLSEGKPLTVPRAVSMINHHWLLHTRIENTNIQLRYFNLLVL